MLDLTPVVFLDPFKGIVTTMPLAMIAAYVPYAEHLHLEEAARVASIRDLDAATNLLLSVQEHAVLSIPYPISEDTGFDKLSVELPTLR